MVNIIDEDFLSCPICLEKYYLNENKIPICLECGHTICKKCIDLLSKEKILECPIDKKVINFALPNQIKTENLILKTTISIIKNLQINAKSLTKLSMIYCKTCNMFISNFVLEIHLTVNHTIQSISQYTLKWFYFLGENIHTMRITPVIKMYLLSYYYHFDNFQQLKVFNIYQIANINNQMFTFYGENYIMTEKNKKMFRILNSIMTYNDEQFSNYSIKKGIIFGINSQIMQGYFLFSVENPKIAIRGFGLLNYHEVSFFGLVSLIPESNHSGFAFDFGVMRDNHTFLYGIFNHNFNEYPLYQLAYGEEITLTLTGVHVLRKNYINEEIGEINEPFVEILSHNSFYLFTNNSLRLESCFTQVLNCTIQFDYNTPCVFKRNLKEITFSFENNDNALIRKLGIKLKNSESNNDYDYLDKSIGDCYLILNSVNVIIFHNEKIKEGIDKGKDNKKEKGEMPQDYMSIIIADDFDFEFKKHFRGYKIIPNKTLDIRIMEAIVKFKLKNIIFQATLLLNLIENLLTTELNQSFIDYQIFQYSNYERAENSDYLTINCEIGSVTSYYYNILKKKMEFSDDKLMTMILYDLLPNFYSAHALKSVSSKVPLIQEAKSKGKSKENVICDICCILI